MKSVLLSLFVLMLAAGVSHAEETQPPPEPVKKTRARYMQSQGMNKYSRMLDNTLTAAEGMEISDEQKEKIATIRVDYINSMIKEELELRKLHTQIMKMVSDPAFDAGNVKKEVEKADAVNKKIVDNYIDGLASLRDTLGPEKYTEVNKSGYRYRHDLIQMRKRQIHGQGSSVRSGETQTQEPEAADDAQDADSADSTQDANADSAQDADNKE